MPEPTRPTDDPIRTEPELPASGLAEGGGVIAEGTDEEPIESNRRLFTGWPALAIGGFAALYAFFHMAALNGLSISAWTGISLPLLPSLPMETWNFRIVHIAGALTLGFLMFAPHQSFAEGRADQRRIVSLLGWLLMIPAVWSLGVAGWFAIRISGGEMWNGVDATLKTQEIWMFGIPLLVATAGGIAVSWFERRERDRFSIPDFTLVVCGFAVATYLITLYGTLMRNSTGTPFAPIGISIAALAGTALIMEMTRRVAGLALIVISGVFLAYVFVGRWLPGFLEAPAVTWERFFSQVYTDAGILGPTTAVSSTYIILFIIFAAFLQASKVGDYFINFAFACAGRARGGPAKVAIFASGLMGMINGTSAGNVVATGSLTIPLMKKVGYKRTTAGAVEAAASTGGQIMPPIMGAGAFIMAEITGIPYTEIALAAVIPAVLYFVSVTFMVDFEAAKLGMRGMREDELPKFAKLVRRVYLFLPIVILIYALFAGYSVIRAGTLATLAAVVVSWISPTSRSLTLTAGIVAVLVLGGLLSSTVGSLSALFGILVLLAVAAAAVWLLVNRRGTGMNIEGVVRAFNIAGVMSVQIIAVCACAGIIVGVISLTGVGARFSGLLLGIADTSQLLALFFAMCISILLGMGMPTTAAYAVAASVVAPGLVQLGIPALTAHFFIFYFAVLSAITPPVALASYAAAGISGANPMATSGASFKIGIAAFVVPFMFFYNNALLMQGDWLEIARACLTACVGVYLLSAGVQGWIAGGRANWLVRAVLIVAALFMIEGGLLTDLIGVAVAVAGVVLAKAMGPGALPAAGRGAD
ncbi:TRAP transporter permease [Pseudoroseicyclus aestuarii]|uniref:TRAP transporter 4TM/12TM fusion protein n=1 Tax=Pseudoroseicyclus aestuarii TaxID=1795041 RepID=A0A318ST60_9RHOB|nr:TRAP transporter fused permease subunit [Pseudoroseicyclus aestuarii]PYE84893.1 TRAP transporter 4TM/12TM fusion protein [Pseudoroseicyclus aestuarii]